MSELRSPQEPKLDAPAEAPPIYFDARRELAARFLDGEGLEIGPLHLPLAMPPNAKPRYVDRMQIDDLRREYPELAGWNLTEVDVVDDGEKLATIAEGTQDFIVANHFLEHCENPIATIETHLGKLKPGGVLFYAVPDKRYTFDFRRPVTPLEHMIADYDEGPERSRAEHYEQWTRLVIVEEGETEEQTIARARELEAAVYSIHMHVWTQAEFLRLILACRERLGDAFDLEATAAQGIEYMVVLRKRGAWPAPAPPPGPAPPAARNASQQAKRVISKLKREARAARQRWRG